MGFAATCSSVLIGYAATRLRANKYLSNVYYISRFGYVNDNYIMINNKENGKQRNFIYNFICIHEGALSFRKIYK